MTVLLSASTIYASGISQQSLSKWYGQSFMKESEKFEDATAIGIIAILKEIKNSNLESKESINEEIKSFLEIQATESKTNLENITNETKTHIGDTEKELENVSFDGYVDEDVIKEEIGQEIKSILTDVLGE